MEPDEAAGLAEELMKIFNSNEFRKKQAAIYTRLFSEDELIRLAELLRDPVMKKFRKQRVVYSTELMRLLALEMDELRRRKTVPPKR